MLNEKLWYEVTNYQLRCHVTSHVHQAGEEEQVKEGSALHCGPIVFQEDD